MFLISKSCTHATCTDDKKATPTETLKFTSPDGPSTRFWLLVPQRNHWIDLGRAASRNVSSKHRYDCQYCDHCEQRYRISTLQSVQHARQQTTARQRQRNADRQAESNEPHSFAQDELEHVEAPRSERHP